MKPSTTKIRKASEAELLSELSKIEEEISSEMHPVSWARCKELSKHKSEIEQELKARKES